MNSFYAYVACLILVFGFGMVVKKLDEIKTAVTELTDEIRRQR